MIKTKLRCHRNVPHAFIWVFGIYYPLFKLVLSNLSACKLGIQLNFRNNLIFLYKNFGGINSSFFKHLFFFSSFLFLFSPFQNLTQRLELSCCFFIYIYLIRITFICRYSLKNICRTKYFLWVWTLNLRLNFIYLYLLLIIFYAYGFLQLEIRHVISINPRRILSIKHFFLMLCIQT
jgi:hypothetical protein